MRSQSSSNIKKQIKNSNNKKNSIDNRSTKAKQSNKKPQMFGISLSRNKNNPNPILFNSIKKLKQSALCQRDNNLNYQSQKKTKIHLNNKNMGLFQQLNTKISINYMNCLYSDLGIQFGCKIKQQIQNKQNINQQNAINQQSLINERNTKVAIPSKQQKQCLQKIKSLINLKNKINQSYQYMKNTQNLFQYLANKSNFNNINIQLKKTNDLKHVHKQISNFLSYFINKQNQLLQLEKRYQEFIKQQKQVEIQQDVQQQELDTIIQNLQQQLNHQNKLCLKYQKQQKFLINKLYFTQKKNNDLRISSTNLKIKNNNLRDTIRLSLSKSQKNLNLPKLQRSFSVKLQRIKKYNLQGQLIKTNQTKIFDRKLIKSRSTSSLNSGRRNSQLQNTKKQTFLDQIY